MTRVLLVLVAFLAVLFVGLLVLFVVLWWLLSRGGAKKAAPEIEIEVPAAPPVPEPAAVRAEVVEVAEPVESAEIAAPAEPDDLKIIEGIGPKFSSVLAAAGITTFAQLAATEVGRVEEILEAESPRLRRLADPGTWPEQARLAAAGDWEGLAALQEELKGGRRV
jgi:predicted flap endonuclease-1-like 5' DNA nuclease